MSDHNPELARLLEELAARKEAVDFSKWKDDPEGFIEDYLGEMLTPDLRKICQSVKANEVTIAQSGNGTGKSWISARLALWFFVTQLDPQPEGEDRTGCLRFGIVKLKGPVLKLPAQEAS